MAENKSALLPSRMSSREIRLAELDDLRNKSLTKTLIETYRADLNESSNSIVSLDEWTSKVRNRNLKLLEQQRSAKKLLHNYSIHSLDSNMICDRSSSLQGIFEEKNDLDKVYDSTLQHKSSNDEKKNLNHFPSLDSTVKITNNKSDITVSPCKLTQAKSQHEESLVNMVLPITFSFPFVTWNSDSFHVFLRDARSVVDSALQDSFPGVSFRSIFPTSLKGVKLNVTSSKKDSVVMNYHIIYFKIKLRIQTHLLLSEHIREEVVSVLRQSADLGIFTSPDLSP